MATTLFKSPILHIEKFKLTPDEARFQLQGYVPEPIAVFPRNPIWIKHDGKQPFVADTSLVNFYNQNQVYTRTAIDPAGDYCHSFWLCEDVLLELLASHEKLTGIFDFQNLPCSRSVFLRQLRILRLLSENPYIDSLIVEEQSIALFRDVLDQRHQTPSFNLTARQLRRNQARIEAVKSSLQRDLSISLSLHSLANIHNISPFHLSRLFKRVTGLGLSQYRKKQRLRAASFAMLEGEDLTTVALQFGFSSHSHLTASFKRYFGFTPSEFRYSQLR